MRRTLLLAALTIAVVQAQAQWQLQQSRTTASLRGIHSLGNGVAWASGTNGTVLHTTDEGTTWQTCPIPPEAEKLDFRGIQAFDAKTAIVMSSGKGDISRLYKTTDACQTWKLVFTNPDKEGFWDAILFTTPTSGYLLGDPVNGRFVFQQTRNGGKSWAASTLPDLTPPTPTTGAFAASNSSLIVPNAPMFATAGAYLYMGDATCTVGTAKQDALSCTRFERQSLPLNNVSPTAGIFSLASAGFKIVAVGGDYAKPDVTAGTAAYSIDTGESWASAKTPPHGYRSAVASAPTQKAWITVGPNGTDLSTDDGRTWRPLKPTAPNADPEEDQHWNALSLPFVVGPSGRIGKLRPDAIQDALTPSKPPSQAK